MADDGTSSLLFRARLCYSMDDYEELRPVMKKMTVVKFNKSLTLNKEERKLLSSAYYNCLAKRKNAWYVLCSIEEKLSELSDTKSMIKLEMVSDSKKREISEIVQICNEIINLLEFYLLTPTNTSILETKLFYTRMKADYFRNLAEVETGDRKEIAITSASNAFDTVIDATFSIDTASLLPLAHPVRLRMGLSYSVFQYEIIHNRKFAVECAERTCQMALSGIDSITSVDTYKDAVLVVSLVKDNISLWKIELEQNTDDVSKPS